MKKKVLAFILVCSMICNINIMSIFSAEVGEDKILSENIEENLTDFDDEIVASVSDNENNDLNYNEEILIEGSIDSLGANANQSKIHNPRSSNGTVTWDCVYFGNYWQNDTNKDGKADKNDAKEPIKWRVLSIDGNDAFLLADMNLDNKRYHESDSKVTWGQSTLRSWLNGYGSSANSCGIDYSGNSSNFMDIAFSASEQAAIISTTLINENNPQDGTFGGDNTVDKVFVLSYADVINSKYGFANDYSTEDTARFTQNTKFADSLRYGIGSCWWLRTPGSSMWRAMYVVGYGSNVGRVKCGGEYVIEPDFCVRPALHLNLSSSNWSYAETESSSLNEFSITYNSNGATSGNAPIDNKKYAGNAIVLGNPNNLQKTGYVFAGWNTAADGSGKTYREGQAILVSKDITLYAEWIDKSKFFYIKYPDDEDDAGEKIQSYNYIVNYDVFFENSCDYNQNLARTSIRTAMAAFDASEANMDRDINIKRLFMTQEYDNYITDYPTPETNSIGYAIGSKKITNSHTGKTATLILVAIRGAGYGAEWGGNFNVYGERYSGKKMHEGFAIAANQVYEGLEKYISDNAGSFEDDIRIWCVGFSRASATANLVAKRAVDEGIANNNPNHVYGYCFEVPQNTYADDAHDPKYNGIHNIVNPIDLVPYVAMNNGLGWKFTRYGNSYAIPSYISLREHYLNLADSMKNEYNKILYYKQNPEIYVNAITKLVYEQEIVIRTGLSGLAAITVNPKGYKNHAQDVAISAAKKNMAHATPTSEELSNMIIQILEDIKRCVIPNPLDYLVGAADENEIKASYFDAHYPELCLAWMDSLSSIEVLNPKRMHILVINCPVDVEVYENQNLVASISNESPQMYENGLYCEIDSNGQKIVYFPDNEDFTYKIYSRESGKMNITIKEIDEVYNEVDKVIAYKDIILEKDRTFLGSINSSDGTESATYELKDNNEIIITPTIIQGKDNITYYQINTVATEGGIAYGDNVFVEGEYATIHAVAEKGYLFKEWRLNNNVVSSETDYRFEVKESQVFIAIFEKMDTLNNDNNHLNRISKLSDTEYVLNLATKEKNSFPELAKSKADGKNYVILINPSEKKVASFNKKGIIKAKKPGTANIMVIKNGVGYKVKVNVFDPHFVYANPKTKYFSASIGEKIIPKYDSCKLETIFTIDKKSLNKGIATIDSKTGELTILKKGTITVTATVGEGKNARKVSTKVKVP